MFTSKLDGPMGMIENTRFLTIDPTVILKSIYIHTLIIKSAETDRDVINNNETITDVLTGNIDGSVHDDPSDRLVAPRLRHGTLICHVVQGVRK